MSGKDDPFPDDPAEILAMIARANAEGDYEAHQVGKADVEFRLPPDLSQVQIDTSLMHLMNHNIVHCTGYGGRRMHAKLRWNYQIKPWVRAQTMCRLGLHRPTPMWKMRNNKPEYVQRRCSCCMKMLGGKQPI